MKKSIKKGPTLLHGAYFWDKYGKVGFVPIKDGPIILFQGDEEKETEEENI